MSRKSFALTSLLFVVGLCLSGCGGIATPATLSIAVTATGNGTTVDANDQVTLVATVTNDKNAAGVTWSVSGGGTLSNSTTSATTYTAPAPSSTALAVTVTATSVSDATKTGTITITVPAKPAITTGALLAGTVGTAYSATMAASGGISPYIWTITSGTLPAGLSMNSAGVISGTPTAAGVGTTNLTFVLTDSGKATALTATVTLGLTINAAPAISFTGAVPATATYNTPYTGSAAAGGGAGALTYSLSSGSLPTGLGINAANGAITGTPTAVNTFSFVIAAADAFGDSATHSYSITVDPATPTLAFTAIAAHTYGDAPFTVSATSASTGAVTYSVTSGPASIVGNTVTITGVGTVVLGASQAAATNYTTATASTSFTVNPETPTLTFAAIATHTFGDAPFTVSATSASSGAVTYSVTSGPATILRQYGDAHRRGHSCPRRKPGCQWQLRHSDGIRQLYCEPGDGHTDLYRDPDPHLWRRAVYGECDLGLNRCCHLLSHQRSGNRCRQHSDADWCGYGRSRRQPGGHCQLHHCNGLNQLHSQCRHADTCLHGDTKPRLQ